MSNDSHYKEKYSELLPKYRELLEEHRQLLIEHKKRGEAISIMGKQEGPRNLRIQQLQSENLHYKALLLDVLRKAEKLIKLHGETKAVHALTLKDIEKLEEENRRLRAGKKRLDIAIQGLLNVGVISQKDVAAAELDGAIDHISSESPKPEVDRSGGQVTSPKK